MRALDYITGSFKMMRHYSHTFWLIFIPVLVIRFVLALFYERMSVNFTADFMTGESPGSTLGMYYLSLFLGMLIGAVIAAIFAVSWHRQALMDETLKYSGQMITRAPVWSYFGGLVLIFLIAFGISVGFFVALSIVGGLFYRLVSGGGLTFTFILFGLIALAFSIWLFVFIERLSLILPARAVEQKVGFGEALEATRGHFWFFVRLMVLLGLIALVLTAPMYIYSFNTYFVNPDLIANAPPEPSPLLLKLYTSAVGVFLSIWHVGILTLLYSHFFRKD